MKNQYTGDVNDFCMYGLLGALTEHGRRPAQLPNGLPHLGADLAMRRDAQTLAGSCEAAAVATGSLNEPGIRHIVGRASHW